MPRPLSAETGEFPELKRRKGSHNQIVKGEVKKGLRVSPSKLAPGTIARCSDLVILLALFRRRN